MTYSLGIWAIGPASGKTLYRWEADGGANGSGHVVFDAAEQTVRPSDDTGRAVGDLIIDAEGGNLRGEADGVNRRQFLTVAAAILKAYAKNGGVPETAHAYFG